jgi:type II secretory pathway predicted ATPase ExeA/DNA-binding transcriptional ArsR family regulator
MKSELVFDERHMKIFKWKNNPFNFRILPDLFVGYTKELNSILNSLRNNDKFSLLIGPTGSGKTTLMKFIANKFDKDKKIFYLSKPPKDPQDWVTIFTRFIKFSFFERLFSRRKRLNLYNLSEWVNKKVKNKNIVLLLDEGHEASLETLEWMRTLIDQVDNLSVILAGLPTLEPLLKEHLETLTCRIHTKVELTNLTRAETREMIKKRIEWSGGDDIKPFTPETIDFIYDKTGGFPREVLRMCNELTQKAIDKGISTVDINFLREIETDMPKRVSLNTIGDLPSKQKTILELLGKYGEMTPSEIASKLDIGSYKDKANAIRSLNNILKRLTKEGLVIRKGKGRSYQYKISEKIKTLMVNT